MSSLSSRARGTVSRAADNPTLERLTRAGFVAYGILHLLFAWVVVRVASGGPAADGDQSGAMQEIADEPFGLVLVVAIVVGLVTMAVWQVLEMLRERRPTERLASAGRAAFYLYLAFSGVKVARGKKSSSADTQQDTAEGLLASSGGRLTVLVAGLVLAGLGGWLAFVGVTGRFEKHLRVGEMAAATRRLVRRLGTAGFVAKGLAYGIAGVLFVLAAWRYEPDRARGLDAALRTLAGEPYGTALLLVVAAGFAAYGLFAVTEARFRKV